MKKNIFTYAIILPTILICILSGIFIFDDKAYIWIAMCVCILACVPFFLSFEGKKNSTKKTVILAAMVALSIVGRYVFSLLPHFKPITAIVVITGMYLGAESGFLCGAMSALLSNFIFGQGPWTPFQMFAWGLIGLLAAILSKPLKQSKIFLCVFGAVSGVLYSLLLDVSATMWYDGAFNISRYLALLATSLPITTVYALSNVAFLLILSKPMGEKLRRIKVKYGL